MRFIKSDVYFYGLITAAILFSPLLIWGIIVGNNIVIITLGITCSIFLLALLLPIVSSTVEFSENGVKVRYFKKILIQFDWDKITDIKLHNGGAISIFTEEKTTFLTFTNGMVAQMNNPLTKLAKKRLEFISKCLPTGELKDRLLMELKTR